MKVAFDTSRTESDATTITNKILSAVNDQTIIDDVDENQLK